MAHGRRRLAKCIAFSIAHVNAVGLTYGMVSGSEPSTILNMCRHYSISHDENSMGRSTNFATPESQHLLRLSDVSGTR